MPHFSEQAPHSVLLLIAAPPAIQYLTDVRYDIRGSFIRVSTEIAQMLGVEATKRYPRVNALKNAGVIKWRVNPEDQRAILIHRDSIDAIKKAMMLA
jgi:hypothetical protein